MPTISAPVTPISDILVIVLFPAPPHPTTLILAFLLERIFSNSSSSLLSLDIF